MLGGEGRKEREIPGKRKKAFFFFLLLFTLTFHLSAAPPTVLLRRRCALYSLLPAPYTRAIALLRTGSQALSGQESVGTFRTPPMASKFFTSDFAWDSLAPRLDEYEAACAALAPSSPPPAVCHQAAWDAFYERHAAGFFHARTYLLACFPLLSTLTASDTVLECGAGNGSNIAALLAHTPARVAAGDASAASLAALAGVPACAQAVAAGRLGIFPWNVAAAPAPQPASIALLLFTLSALAPREHSAALRNLAASLPLGGHLCFRDYGHGDLAQLRAPPCSRLAREPQDSSPDAGATHRRSDGTLAHYFKVAELRALLEAAGFEPLELLYHTVENRNRKSGQSMQRVFVHALARRIA